MEEELRFFSQGVPVGGKIFIPEDHQPGQRRAAWILVGGYSTTYAYKGTREDLGRRLASVGYVALTFDYRGFGVSQGERMVHPLMQCTDICNSITYLQTRSEVDELRIGVIGQSFGGATAPYVAAIDDRVAAVISMYGIGDCERWLRSLRHHGVWQELLHRVEENRKKRVTTGKGDYVDAFEIMPMLEADLRMNVDDLAKGTIGGDILLESAEAIIQFKPEQFVHLISPRPVLYVHSAIDKTVAAEEGVSLYEHSGEPKDLWLLPSSFFQETHYETFEGTGQADKPSKWQMVADAMLGWMRKWLPAEPLLAGTPYAFPRLEEGQASRLLRNTSWLRKG